MLGHNHVMVNATLGAVVGAAVIASQAGVQAGAEVAEPVPWFSLSNLVPTAAIWLQAPWSPGAPITWQLLLWLAGAVALYLVGSLVPDIDNPKSKLGRYFAWLPMGPHRGLTHSLLTWGFISALVAVTPQFRLGAFLVAGALLHVLADAPSWAGWAPLWPLNLGRTKWRVTSLADGSTMVVQDSGPRLYQVGSLVETMLVITVTLTGVLIAVALLWPVVTA